MHESQILFSGKNKKNITNLSSAELAKRVLKFKLLVLLANDVRVCLYEKKTLILHKANILSCCINNQNAYNG